MNAIEATKKAKEEGAWIRRAAWKPHWKAKVHTLNPTCIRDEITYAWAEVPKNKHAPLDARKPKRDDMFGLTVDDVIADDWEVTEPADA